jgi:hypothetical protein
MQILSTMLILINNTYPLFIGLFNILSTVSPQLMHYYKNKKKLVKLFFKFFYCLESPLFLSDNSL